MRIFAEGPRLQPRHGVSSRHRVLGNYQGMKEDEDDDDDDDDDYTPPPFPRRLFQDGTLGIYDGPRDTENPYQSLRYRREILMLHRAPEI